MTISKKKRSYPISEMLWEYLQNFRRKIQLPLTYEELRYFKQSFPLRNTQGKDTLWETALYDTTEVTYIHDGLKKMYSILRTEGDETVHEHLHVERVDYCTFGNSNPFRIKIVNNFNDNYDYFYVKQADASRVYGLELEHILSPARINFYADKNTLVEEHIAGIPGDQFIQNNLLQKDLNKTRVAKEFVKFNERCLVRLLGDMRSYNYVFDLTPDFEEVQYRIRAIDFDQQSYEGRRNLYMPQFFKENNPIVELVRQLLNTDTIRQYQKEERTLISRRINSSAFRLDKLLAAMKKQELAPVEKVETLKNELSEYYANNGFVKCNTMGEIVQQSLAVVV
jgi:hypothetical protein